MGQYRFLVFNETENRYFELINIYNKMYNDEMECTQTLSTIYSKYGI